ncbi:MAG: ComEC/Rec2 family competence protein [Bryobacteraceae bacterium]
MRSLLVSFLCTIAAFGARTLEIHFVDVEGGQATLIVSPAGESLLVDAGWPGFNGRDADRIIAAARKAGVNKIDYLMLTHYHRDHAGGVLPLAERFPVINYVNHGPNTESGKPAEDLSAAYEQAVAKGKRLVVKPGDKIPVKGLDVTVVTARGEQIAEPLTGGGQPNPLCSEARHNPDPSENARSTGIVVGYGRFRFMDIGDLTWNKELDLVCPNNRVGKVDLYLTTHHGLNTSGPAGLVHAVAPRVAIMNNGARKGGTPEAWQIVRKSPGLEDLWQVHFAVAGGSENNTAEAMIANLEEQCQGHGLSVSAEQDGSFTVINHRNKFQKRYGAKK